MLHMVFKPIYEYLNLCPLGPAMKHSERWPLKSLISWILPSVLVLGLLWFKYKKLPLYWEESTMCHCFPPHSLSSCFLLLCWGGWGNGSSEWGRNKTEKTREIFPPVNTKAGRSVWLYVTRKERLDFMDI